MPSVRYNAVWLCALWLWSATAHAQPPSRAAVTPLNDRAAERGLDAEAARVLRPTQMTVLHGAELGTWIRKRRAPQPDANILKQFAPATQTIAKGVEQFFYMSADKAVPSLEPVVELAWHHPEVLAHRPDLADQIWQAGIILVRAVAETEGAKPALAQAQRLITLLPSRKTDPKVVPPDIRKLLDEAREGLADSGAHIRLSAPDPERCTLYLNGAVAEPQESYVVDPQGTYFAHADCSQPTAPPVWIVPVEAQRTVERFVPPVEPHTHRMDGDDRRRTEWYLQAIAGLADTDVTVGVLTTADDEAVVLVRYDRATQSITWSDDEYSDSIRRGMPRIFPEYAELFDGPAPPPTVRTRTERRRVDWLGVASVASGVALAGVGTYMVVSAGRQSRLLDCAVNNPSPPGDVDCTDLRDDIYFDDFAGETRKVGAVRTGGYVMVGVGVLATAFGVYRLVRPRPNETAWRMTPGGLEVRW